jgi:hypothetical protein
LPEHLPRRHLLGGSAEETGTAAALARGDVGSLACQIASRAEPTRHPQTVVCFVDYNRAIALLR